jgi:hypothetical protein
MGELERAGEYLMTALSYFDRPDTPVRCTLQAKRHSLLYSAASLACDAEQFERARQLLTEALAPAAGCEPDQARAVTKKIEKYTRDHGLAAECLPAAATRMTE